MHCFQVFLIQDLIQDFCTIDSVIFLNIYLAIHPYFSLIH